MAEYDITQAFKRIEDELIASMIRNMDRHRAEEMKEGLNWTMWQAEQLKALEKYKRENQKKYSKEFTSINGQVKALIQQARDTGSMEQEISILNAIKKGYQPKGNESRLTGQFFRLNDRKLETLIQATTRDMKKAETAVLRKANDEYRKSIFNAQVYANSGAGTYGQAVDMATKDMLSRGLVCVEYKNGTLHSLEDYADMAIRTANKRAYLQGEGAKRQEWGISTVIMNKRGNPCPLCLPWVGKVLIDDVWSDGSEKEGDYPLMSTAVAAGLYHPRCQDSHSTYFPGVSTTDDTWTKEELEAVEAASKKKARQQYAERQVEKFERLSEHSLDADNQERYRAKASEWDERADERYKIGDGIVRPRGDAPERMVDLVEQYTADDFTVIDNLAEDAYFYDFDIDKVVINKEHPSFEYYDYNKTMLHEVAHRIDRNEFSSPMNTAFADALASTGEKILDNRLDYEKLFAPGGKFEYNDFMSDIFSSLTGNEVCGNWQHSMDYLQIFGNRELEVFANMFAEIYAGTDESVDFIRSEMPELYKEFIRMIGGQ